MKDTNEVWIVLKDGSHLKTAIVCESGKEEAKEIRRSMTKQHGGSWLYQKTTKSLIALAKA